MRFLTNFLSISTGCILLVSCAKTDVLPGDTVKTFLDSSYALDLDKLANTLAPDLRMKILADKKESKKSLEEAKANIDKCGGYKNFTPNYVVKPDSSSVEGYTLIEHSGSCPAEKQYVRLSKIDNKWLIEEFGPSVK